MTLALASTLALGYTLALALVLPLHWHLHSTPPQWVGMALFAQALTFYVPHFLWKTWEGKKVISIARSS